MSNPQHLQQSFVISAFDLVQLNASFLVTLELLIDLRNHKSHKISINKHELKLILKRVNQLSSPDTDLSQLVHYRNYSLRVDFLISLWQLLEE